MDKKEIELRIERVKEKKPEVYNEVLNVAVPFYMLHQDLVAGIHKIQENYYGITSSEHDVMRCLYLSKNDENMLSPTKIYNKLMFTSGAITKVLKKLEDKGYIVRVENKNDKRSKLVKLTDKGAKVCKDCFIDMLAHDEKRFSKLNEEERKTFTNLVNKLLH